jgi:hypothetical protein
MQHEIKYNYMYHSRGLREDLHVLWLVQEQTDVMNTTEHCT